MTSRRLVRCGRGFPWMSQNYRIPSAGVNSLVAVSTLMNQNSCPLTPNFCSTRGMMSYSKFINDIGKNRQPSATREMTKLMSHAKPGTIFMAGGLPNPELFPFQSMKFQIDSETEFKIEGAVLRSALQYQPTTGYPALLETLKEIQLKFHNPPNWENSDLIVTVGSQQGLSDILGLTVSVGDTIVVPEPIYCNALSILDPFSPTYLPVSSDEEGIQPDEFERVMATWSSSGTNKMPKILYTNPVGCNPSGVNVSTERKHKIYAIAQKYDLLILEDDPYYYLHFEKTNPVSFLSMDKDGRVIRFDSFSKILSSGLRIGFTTGPKELIRYLELSMQSSILHASSLSQVVVDGVLRHWGIDGFINHTHKVQQLYRKRRDIMLSAAKKHLSGLAEWHVPQAGMFLWIKVLGIRDTNEMVMKHGIKEGILLLPGKEFMTDRKAPCSFLRASFSVVSYDDMDKGLERLAHLIRDEQKRQ